MNKTINFTKNIPKLFFYILTQRRNFIPILAIYFLTLPNTTAQQIGIYTGIGFLASFLFEIPSGYISDKFGQKNTLVLSKISLVLSTFIFIISKSLGLFILGSALMAIGQALNSGTLEVFLHNTLIKIKKEKQFSKILGKLRANASIFSAILMISLPFLTKIDIIVPLLVGLFLDICGLIITYSLKEPVEKIETKKINFKSFKRLIKLIRKTDFLYVSLFFGLIIGYLIGSSPYKEVYLKDLGLPLIFIGFSVGLSRVFWYIIGHNVHKIYDKINFKKLLKFEIILFPILFILASLINNPYIVLIIFALFSGYYWGRKQIETNYLLNKYQFNKNFKVTILSIASQIGMFIQFLVAFIIGYFMQKSYSLGFLLLGISLFIFLIIVYRFIKK